MVIAFDIDGCLIDYNDNPRQEVIALLKALHHEGNEVIVWSGGGEAYALMWVARLKLEGFVDRVCSKPTAHKPIDLAIDDMPVKLGKLNLCVEDVTLPIGEDVKR